jgi:hypothetical protein
VFVAETAKEQPTERLSAIPEVFLSSRPQGFDDGADGSDVTKRCSIASGNRRRPSAAPMNYVTLAV